MDQSDPGFRNLGSSRFVVSIIIKNDATCYGSFLLRKLSGPEVTNVV